VYVHKSGTFSGTIAHGDISSDIACLVGIGFDDHGSLIAVIYISFR